MIELQRKEINMNTEEKLDDQTVRILLEHIDEIIESHKQKMAELQKAKEKLLGLNTDHKANIRTPKGRLPMGVPKRLTLKAFQKYNALTIRELRERIKEDNGFDLRDSTARRAIGKLKDEGRIRLRDDGVFELVENTKETTDIFQK